MATKGIENALRRIDRLEAQLREARADLRREIREAYADGGATIAELSRRVKVSRTRVRQLLGLEEDVRR